MLIIKNAFNATHYFKNNAILYNGTEQKVNVNLITNYWKQK